MRRFISCFLTATLATAATAQDAPNTILVLDGSGSMWGQIDGVAKITIAQEVVSELLSDFPADQGLGLTVYGHRERGNCTDIETIVAPAPGTAGSIVDAVNGVKPLGKTPMTDAVIAAAEALRYTEDSATVILVSDGVETCNPDPCAAARLLEEAGINFTAHVVGFDVDDPEAIAQMQCIAEETGGKFLTAANADELDLAMTEMVAAEPAPEPEPALVPVTFTAIEGEDGPVIGDPILWSIAGADVSDTAGNPYEMDLPEGSYVATAYRVSTETALDAQFVAIGNSAEVVITFPVPVEHAKVIAPTEAPLGSMIQVGWDGPDNENDYIGIGKVGADGAAAWQNYTYTRDGNPLMLLMPPEPGDYVISYFDNETRDVLGSAPITATPVTVSIAAPAEAIAGDEIAVDWTGPDYENDYIGIGLVGANGAAAWENYTYTRDGDPLSLQVPAIPGAYAITYFLNQDRTVMATAPITVTDVTATLSAPAEAVAGSDIEVTWTGPDYDNDYIGIGKSGATGASAWENYTYTRDGDPLTLTIPSEPGDYVISYFVNQDRVVLATTDITVTEAGASVTAPSEAVAGSDIEISWNGPGYENDYVGIGKVGATGGGAWENYTYVRADSAGTLLAPMEPGDYVISYFLQQDRTVLASTPITLTKVEAGVTAPATAPMGSTISVDWTGPDYENDYIGIGKVGETGGGQWQNYSYTHDGNPASLLVPSEPGEYVIRYIAQQDRSTLSSTTINVTEVTAQLVADSTAQAGTEIIVGWDGPNYDDDYIAIGRVGATGGARWESYAYTSSGNPVTLNVPEEPGDYLIQYFIQQDRVPLAPLPLTVE